MAVIEHVPVATIVTSPLETVHTEVVIESKLTARPEFVVAFTVNGDTPRLTFFNGGKVITCHAANTVKL